MSFLTSAVGGGGVVGKVDGAGGATPIDQKCGGGKGIRITDVNEFNPARGRLGIGGVGGNNPALAPGKG